MIIVSCRWLVTSICLFVAVRYVLTNHGIDQELFLFHSVSSLYSAGVSSGIMQSQPLYRKSRSEIIVIRNVINLKLYTNRCKELWCKKLIPTPHTNYSFTCRHIPTSALPRSPCGFTKVTLWLYQGHSVTLPRSHTTGLPKGLLFLAFPQILLDFSRRIGILGVNVANYVQNLDS